MTRRRGRLWPQGVKRKLRSEKLRAEFSFPIGPIDDAQGVPEEIPETATAFWRFPVKGLPDHPQRLLEDLEDRNLLKLRSLDSSCPFFLSDTSIWGQGTEMLQMLWSQG